MSPDEEPSAPKAPQVSPEEQEGMFKRFRDFIDAIKGRKDVKTKLEVLTDPKNLHTMSVLTKEEAHYLATCNWLVMQSWGAMFLPMKQFAESVLEPNISVGGRGREDSIKFVAALSEARTASKMGENQEKKKE